MVFASGVQGHSPAEKSRARGGAVMERMASSAGIDSGDILKFRDRMRWLGHMMDRVDSQEGAGQ